MEKLLKITNGKQLVLSRELHQFLEVGRDFTSWIKKRIEKYKFVENEDYQVISSFPQNGGKGGRPKEEYLITLDMAKELSMVENNEKGRQARKYFIECEKKHIQSLEQKNKTSNDTFVAQIEKDLDKIKIIERNIELLVEELKPLYDNVWTKAKWKADNYYKTVAIAKANVDTLHIENGKVHIEIVL